MTLVMRFFSFTVLLSFLSLSLQAQSPTAGSGASPDSEGLKLFKAHRVKSKEPKTFNTWWRSMSLQKAPRAIKVLEQVGLTIKALDEVVEKTAPKADADKTRDLVHELLEQTFFDVKEKMNGPKRDDIRRNLETAAKGELRDVRGKQLTALESLPRMLKVLRSTSSDPKAVAAKKKLKDFLSGQTNEYQVPEAPAAPAAKRSNPSSRSRGR